MKNLLFIKLYNILQQQKSVCTYIVQRKYWKTTDKIIIIPIDVPAPYEEHKLCQWNLNNIFKYFFSLQFSDLFFFFCFFINDKNQKSKKIALVHLIFVCIEYYAIEKKGKKIRKLNNKRYSYLWLSTENRCFFINIFLCKSLSLLIKKKVSIELFKLRSFAWFSFFH